MSPEANVGCLLERDGKKMLDWQIKVAMDTYKERIDHALRDYEIQQAIKANRAENNTNTSSTISTLIGGLLVGLGKRLQSWGATLTNSPQAQTR
jgi:hypothetical protein